MTKITLDTIFRNFATITDSIESCDLDLNPFRCSISTLNTSRNFKELYFVKIPIIEENIFTRIPLFLLPYYYHSFQYKSECVYSFKTTESNIKSSFFSILDDFLPRYYTYSREPFVKYTVKDTTVFINRGIILNENFKPLVLLLPKVCPKLDTKSFILKQDDWEVLLDCSLFTDKNSLSAFVKNNLLPILTKYKYVIKIMDLQSKEIFQKPVIPNQTLGIKDSLYKTLKKYYNNDNLLSII